MLDLLKEGIQEALQERTLVCHGSGPATAPCPTALTKERVAVRLAKEKQLQEHLDAYKQVCQCCMSHYRLLLLFLNILIYYIHPDHCKAREVVAVCSNDQGGEHPFLHIRACPLPSCRRPSLDLSYPEIPPATMNPNIAFVASSCS